MRGVKLLGTGSALPSRRVTNDDLARLVDTSDEWVSSRTGIRERRWRGPGEGQLSLAAEACRLALEAAGAEPEEVGVCLVATFTPDYATPSCACLLQGELGLAEDTLCLDLNAACAGFVYALHTAACLLGTADRPLALVVGAEALSRVLDLTDRSTCVLFGDGAGAAVMGAAEGWPQLHTVWGTRADVGALAVPGPGTEAAPHLSMDGRVVFRFAVETLPRCVEEVLEKAGIGTADVDRFVFHQANRRIVDAAARRLGIDDAACAGNIERVGNTSAASVPILLDELVRSGALASGQRALVAGFGAGLTWAGALLELA